MTDKAIDIDPSKKTITIGTHTFTINYPGFWKWFGIGTVIVGVALAIWTQIGG